MKTKISIYQTFPRLFGNKNKNPKIGGSIKENGVGKFNDYTSKALLTIRDLGITHIWYVGIIEHGTTTDYSKYGIAKDHPALVKGKAGSPYAIKDYYDVNPDLAVDVKNRMTEFESLVQRTHEAGLKVIIDIVANHIFRQYHSDVKPEGVEDFGQNDDTTKAFDPQNNFYYLPQTSFELPDGVLSNIAAIKTAYKPYIEVPARITGNDVFAAKPDIEDWYETAKLNYGVDLQGNGDKCFNPVPDTWKKMTDIMLFWASKGVDGFRCDMAEMIPVEFWNYAVNIVKKHYPDLIFIGETYNPLEYYNYINFGGFDFLYDKVGLYDTLKNIIIHNASTLSISNCWKVLEGLDARMLRFIENHDEVRLASMAFAGDAKVAIPAMTLVATMNRGPVMIYGGQEVGEPAQGESGFSGDDGRTTIYDYFAMPEHQKWMNNGKFDGGGLSADQTLLRQFYQKILNFSLRYDAIANGEFYDLMWANPYGSLPQRNKIYIWLRHTSKQKLLFVISFDKSHDQQIRIKISDHAFNEMGWWKCCDFEAKELLWNMQKLQFDRKTAIETGLIIDLRPNDALIFEIVPKDCREE
ncbi:MAG TPA: alpha-amylase family protein [Bacteroidales bacterium]|jgi:glycosidase|nr:alpha-amylase family protein [Bacteroidales bacterium]OQC36632.1 MAG: Alpha-amylase precursor [Bacteroidetes bacterium ADurb.Bin041]MBP7874261.1 alpha-amylase family protein [Bacteroidales bacterium]MCZ2283596.1 alpha-amylase family protein [Bacteroidales bacterium]HNV50826.1 alpha-amylase family protein [Bacteroidales bacterium]